MSGLRNEEEERLVHNDEVRENDGNAVEDTKRRIKARYILAVLGFLGFANVYAMRVNLSVAIVAMVNSTSENSGSNQTFFKESFHFISPLFPPSRFHSVLENSGNSPQIDSVCPVRPPVNGSKDPRLNGSEGGEFSWDEQTQGLILGSFFYGYVATQIPGGRLSELLGGHRIFGLGVLFTGIFTLLSPPVARLSHHWGITPFVILRVLEGLTEGVTFPAMMAMLAKWAPPLERSTLTAITYAGALFGTVISMPISGILCAIDLPVYLWLLGPGGWPLAFYIFGALSILWFIAWMALVSDSPATHPSISPEERNFIEHSLQQNERRGISNLTERRVSSTVRDPADIGEIPWCQLFTSVPLWAALLTMCGQSWAFYTLLTELPTYMDKVLHYNIMQNSFLSALPYLANWLFSLPVCWMADWLRAHGYLSTTASLIVFNSISVVIPSLSFIGVAYAGCHSNVILILLVISGAFTGANYAGVQVNHLALSPRLAATLYGITNSASNVCGFLAPYAAGSIINGHETISRWRYVFLISAGVNLVTNFVYIAFASGEVQPWDNPRFDDEQNSSRNPDISIPVPVNDEAVIDGQGEIES